MSTTPARKLAYQAILRVVGDGAYLDRLLPTLFERYTLTERDRALAFELCTGTLKNYRRLDAIGNTFAKKKMEKMPLRLRAAIWLGIYQIAYTRIPPHAAISQSTSLLGPKHLRGAANGILRNIERNPQSYALDEKQSLAVRYSHPQWFVEAIQGFLGEELENFLQANQDEAPTYLRLRASRELAEARLQKEGITFDVPKLWEEALPAVRQARASGSPWKWAAVQDGVAVVQDLSAQAVVSMLGAKGGETVLDMCAAPGGKALALADTVGDMGLVLACDLHAHRLQLLKRHAHAHIESHVVDAADLNAMHDVAGGRAIDRIMLDAPCSGMGTLRRTPELRFKKPPGLDLLSLQRALLETAAQLLKPHGTLVYAVCSPLVVEGVEHIEAFLLDHPEFQEVPSRFTQAGLRLPARPGIQFWPHRHGGDAFYAACLKKSGHPA